MGDKKEKKFNDKKDKCCCEENKYKKHNNNHECRCGDDCNCHEDDECKCCDACTCGDDCDCNSEHKCCDECTCDENCCCHNHDDDHNDCGCGCCHDAPSAEQYQQMFMELQQAIIEADKQLKKAKDEVIDSQRLAVSYKKDLERYKERNQNIQSEAQNNAIENIASVLIPILDQFESALKATADSAEKKGFEMINSSLIKAVGDLGIEEIYALGKAFDSNFHNAISKVEVQDKEKDGVVTAVYQKGYKLKNNDKIVRYAMVEIGEYQGK